MGTGIVGVYGLSLHEKIERAWLVEIWKYVTQTKALIRFTMKCPDKIRQQTVHTVCMERGISNENVNRKFVTKPHNVATTDFQAWLI